MEFQRIVLHFIHFHTLVTNTFTFEKTKTKTKKKLLPSSTKKKTMEIYSNDLRWLILKVVS